MCRAESRPLRFLATFTVTALLFASVCSAALTQVTVRPVKPGSVAQIAELTFDTPVCIGLQNERALRPIYVSPAAVLQTRFDGSTLSIAIGTTLVPSCVMETVFTLNLPPLPDGQYTLQVGEARQLIFPNFNSNNAIQKVALTSFVVGSSLALPAVGSVYSMQGSRGSYLSVVDAASFQYLPTYASDLPRWQPIFNVWLIGLADVIPEGSGLQRVFALTFRGPADSERFFYTIDVKERDGLLASGAFSQPSGGPSFGAFYAVPATGGVCRTGLTAIYRAFEPTLMLHRYVPVETYRSLVANGWKADGPAFCTPTPPTSASLWVPN